jgi:hypothetical protein
MSTQMTPENAEKLLKRHNQSHILAFWGQLDPAGRGSLLAQIEQLDFSKIGDWVANYVKKCPSAAVPADFAPAQSYSPVPDSRTC